MKYINIINNVSVLNESKIKMKITSVHLEIYKWPKQKPISNGKYVYKDSYLNLIVIETDEGITGYGSSWELDEKLVKSMGQKLIGEDPLNNERI